VGSKATFLQYLRAFTARWFVLMSGPLSVPAAIGAAIVPNWVARILLAGTAIVCILFSSYWVWRIEREKRAEAENALAVANDFTLTEWGNVRVADNPAVVNLFKDSGPERNKFLALLTGERLSCWARRMTPASSDLVKVPGSVWNAGSNFNFEPKRQDDPRTINQTFIRDHASRPLFYDLYLNFTEMRRIWPTIELTEATEEVR
jgi:hypothetical protein